MPQGRLFQSLELFYLKTVSLVKTNFWIRDKMRAYYSNGVLWLFILGMVGCASFSNENRIDDMPMYGQPEVVREEYRQKADAAFIKDAANGFGGNRKMASAAWAKEAEAHFNKRNLHYAMRRYNQSWLLDPENYQPYVGFGRITLARREYDDAFKHFKRAIELINDPFQKPVLLANTAVAYHNKANSLDNSQAKERERYFDWANSYFEESTQLDPSYPNSWASWAYSLFRQGKYEESWLKLAKLSEFAPEYINKELYNELSEVYPEPGT